MTTQETTKAQFPRHLYKRGTGKAVDDNGKFEAESVVVRSQEEMDRLEGSWCDSPVEAATGAAGSTAPKKDAVTTGAAPATGANPSTGTHHKDAGDAHSTKHEKVK